MCESACLLCTLHVWMTTSAIHNNTQSDAQHVEYDLMFVCLVSEDEDSPEIEMLYENIRMANHFTVKASFIIALEEPRLVCSIWAPFLPQFTSATRMYLTQCQLSLPFLSYPSLSSCQVTFVTKEVRFFLCSHHRYDDDLFTVCDLFSKYRTKRSHE